MITKDLLKLLRRHYIGDSLDPRVGAGGVFLAEVGENGAFGASRRCDALYAGFTSASGRTLIGHELKVSRADWRHELSAVAKADKWADACHAWYVVAPSADIVPPEELPDGWGLMLPPKAANQRRMQIVVKAHVKAGHQPPWWALRSMLARLDTLETEERRQLVQQMVDKQVEEHDRRRERANKGNVLDHHAMLRLERLTTFEEELGVELGMQLDAEATPPRYPPDVLAAALKLADLMRHRKWSIETLERGSAEVRQALDVVDKTLPELRKALGIKGRK